MIDENALELLDREDLVKMITALTKGGVFINFHGNRSAMEIKSGQRLQPLSLILVNLRGEST